MRRLQHPSTMESRASELVAMLILPLIHVARTTAERILSCDVTSLEPCGADSQQFCNQTTLSCQCLPGLRLVEGHCEAAEASGSAAAVWGALVAALLCLSLLGAALVLAARRYHLLQWLRQRLQPPNSAYEDVMIGADDPPLSL